MRFSHRIAQSIALTVGFLVVGSGCDRVAEPGANDELRVTRGDLAPILLLTGELEATKAVILTVPQTNQGALQIETLVPDGSEVHAGDVVVSFDSSSFTTDLEQRRTAVERARRALSQAKAQARASLENAKLASERARNEVAKAQLEAEVPESIQSRYEFAQRQIALERARVTLEKAEGDERSTTSSTDSDVRIAEENLATSERELAESEHGIQTLTLVAPRDGVVVVADHPWEGRPIQPGDTIWPGWTVVSLPDLAELHVVATLFDVDDGRIAPGLPARCVVDTYPDLALNGRVTSVTSIAREVGRDSLRRGFDLAVELEATPQEPPLVPGMSVRLEIPQAPRRDVVIAPRAALDLGSDPPRASTATGWRDVEVGMCSALECEIVSGLDVGEPLRVGGGENA
jgi:multidrug resistance efflux pump